MPNRRAFLQVAALDAAALAAACAPAAAPAAAPVISHAVQEAAASAQPAQEAIQGVVEGTGWEREWEDVIAAATAEGRLSLLTWGMTWGGSGYPAVIESFEQAFPGIKVDQLAESSASVWLGKVLQERRAGTYSFDLALVQPDAALTVGRQEGLWAPIRPLLFRPDVLEDGAWRDGLNARFLDAGGNLCLGWEYQVIHAYAINTDMVAEGEIGSVGDLLAPKWRGKVLSSDPLLGLGLLSAASVAKHWGAEVVKRLLVDQRPTIDRVGGRQLAEALVRGRYPVALGVRPKALAALGDQQLAGKVRFLDLPDADYAATTPMLYFDRAPHPAAAKLFANWILTKEGQTVLTSSLPTNSARTDVAAFAPDGIGTAGAAYFEPDKEASHAHTAETQRFVSRLLGTTT